MNHHEGLMDNPRVKEALNSFEKLGVSFQSLEDVQVCANGQIDLVLSCETSNDDSRQSTLTAFYLRAPDGSGYTVEIQREIWTKEAVSPNNCQAFASCYAEIDNNEQVVDYRIGFGDCKDFLLRFYLGPEGNVLGIDDEWDLQLEEMYPGDAFERFPPFNEVLQSFVETPLNPNLSSSAFSPLAPLIESKT
jgi:uncharacterized protein with GYD domain